MKIFLDDIRNPPNDSWVIIRSTEELITFYQENHKDIDILSLDHDLGDGLKTGYDFLLWLEERVFHGKINLPNCIIVHSANSVGQLNMIQKIRTIFERIKNV